MAFRLNEERKETENKTIRFPLPLINRIEEELSNTNVTFSKFVIQACDMLLKIWKKMIKKIIIRINTI